MADSLDHRAHGTAALADLPARFFRPLGRLGAGRNSTTTLAKAAERRADFGDWLRKDRRLARLARAYGGAPVDVLPAGTDFQIKRRESTNTS